MNDRERRIRETAYQLWEEAGRPEGEEHKHWLEAERRLAAEAGEPAPETVQEAGKKPAKAPKAAALGAADAAKAAVAAGKGKADPKMQPKLAKKERSAADTPAVSAPPIGAAGGKSVSAKPTKSPKK
ncbi:DUF2934 domain-containing protein [Hansschlegelia sp.]|uniref:DUF2934 domain-containing protein n=1 Tax=Hansschlegelia sp. TaxID=2041892 RepID=UPI002C99F6A8|nr:DUF2934 domain-containing protein [Hansschlegelia sp.]HVI28050.1 DUF2934 domain-containing protein [Hansschlegelia sp.]